MKRKFITLGVVAVLLIVAVLAMFTLPVMSPDVTPAVVDGLAAAETADLAVMNSELTIAGYIVPAAVVATAEPVLWVALGAILLTLTVVNRRRLEHLLRFKSIGQRRYNTDEGAFMGGGANRCIMPAAA